MLDKSKYSMFIFLWVLVFAGIQASNLGGGSGNDDEPTKYELQRK